MNKVVIIGAGISGLSIAYNLYEVGYKDITIIDASYFMAGATGRNGAGVRMQWGSPLNILLSKYSVAFYESFNQKVDYDDSIDFIQNGYLILSHSKKEHKQFEKNVFLQNQLGVPSKLLSKNEVLKMVPKMNKDAFYGASFCDKDGHLNPFKVSEAFYLDLVKKGITFKFNEKVYNLKKENRFFIETEKALYQADQVMVCAGYQTKDLLKLVDITLPTTPEKHEILATIPVTPRLKPMVMSFHQNFYLQQVPHGPLIMGLGTSYGPKNGQSTYQFIEAVSKTILNILPQFKDVSIQRQWVGFYDMSPDRNPIISKTRLDGLFVACGFSGRGFMIAPATGKIIADLVLNQSSSIQGINLAALSLDRFDHLESLAIEKSFV